MSDQKASVIVTEKLNLKTGQNPADAVWASSDENVATVSDDGTVTGIKAGNALITASYDGGVSRYAVTVKNGISKKRMTLKAGESGSLKLLGTKIKSAKSDDPKVASVTKTGRVRGISGGTATVTLTGTDGKNYRCRVTVRATDTASETPAYGQDADGILYESSEEVVEVSTAEEFALAMSEMIDESNTANSLEEAAKDRFYSKRLIVKTDGADISFGAYNPSQVVKDIKNLYYVQFSTSKEAENACNAIADLPHIIYVEPDGYCGISENVSDVQYSAAAKSWGTTAIGADKYAATLEGNKKSITVAVIDSGVASHSYLNSRILSGGYDFVDGDSNPNDTNGHGTHVAGIVVDCTPGLNVNILPIRVLAKDGSGNDSVVSRGIDRAVSKGASVINLSLGGEHSYRLEEAVKDAVKAGVVVVTVSGNESANTSNYCPAHMSDPIVVGAVDSKMRRASFSNYGSSVDLVAPGVEIKSCSTNGGYEYMDGTSMAAPHISGIAAMVKLANPSFTPANIDKYIKDCCEDLGTTGWDKYFGYGIPDMSKASGAKEVEVTGISISRTSLTLARGESEVLKATLTPANATSKEITWKSSNTDIATVNSDGRVRGVNPGVADITASSTNGKKATCRVTVYKLNDGEISASVSSLTLALDKSEQKAVTISHKYSYDAYYSYETSGNYSYASFEWKDWNETYDSCDLLVSAVSSGTFKFRVKLIDSDTEEEVATTPWISVHVTEPEHTASISASASSVNLDLNGTISKTITISHGRYPDDNVYYNCVTTGNNNYVKVTWGSWNTAGNACPLTISALNEGTLSMYVELYDSDTDELLAQTSVIKINVSRSRAAQPMTVSTKTVSVSASALKNAKQTISKSKVFVIKNAKGSVTFTRVRGSGKLSISKSGVVTVGKGAGKG
ncbi:MAG: S8 family serine peptidase, partial [Lachnospiraceae bacterium]|nr:S8 family serine peptidase [Lachnospiraceae bacterium]